MERVFQGRFPHHRKGGGVLQGLLAGQHTMVDQSDVTTTTLEVMLSFV